MEHQYTTFHGMSNRDDYRTIHWSSSGPGFHLKISFNSLCEIIEIRNYRKVVLLNLKMLLCAG